MKRFGYALFFVGLLLWGWWIWQRQETDTSPLPLPTPKNVSAPLLGLSKNEQDLVSFEVAGKSYRVAWHLVDPSALVSMGINTDLASASGDIYRERECTILTSGGFYSTQGKPIGLLVADGKEVSPWQQNQLFTGVLGSDGGRFVIEFGDVSGMSFQWAVQAGPVVWMNRSATTLSLKNDQEARRIMAGVTTDGSLVLMAVVAGDSLFGGPKLADVGTLLPVISTIVGKEFESVINLDGGTASALISETISLRELKPIGSFVCVR